MDAENERLDDDNVVREVQTLVSTLCTFGCRAQTAPVPTRKESSRRGSISATMTGRRVRKDTRVSRRVG